MKNTTWNGKSVWLTGASSGIGKALALKLADMGAIVIVSARRESELNDLAKLAPNKIIPLALDLSDSEQVDVVTQQLADRVEALDVIILAAGVVHYEDDLQFDINHYRSVFDINFFGVVNSVASAMPLLKKSQVKPYIVGITSMTVLTGFPRAEIYGSSKAAADYFLKSLRMDLSPETFDISIIRPGFVKTPMTSVNDFPMPFIMSIDDAVNRIIKAMDKRQFIVDFPKRFSFILKVLSFFTPLWYRVIGPRINRNQKLNQKTKH